MAIETKYKVWGYWAKYGRDTNHNRKLIDSAETLEEAHQIRESSEQMRWPTVCITKDDRIVEPVEWAGLQHPLVPPAIRG